MFPSARRLFVTSLTMSYRGGRKYNKYRHRKFDDSSSASSSSEYGRRGGVSDGQYDRRNDDTGDGAISRDGGHRMPRGSGVGRRGRGGHPPGLKGREIGLYYAQLSKAKKREQELENRGVVGIEQGYAEYLENLVGDDDTDGSAQSRSMEISSNYDIGRWWKASISRNHGDDEKFMNELRSLHSNPSFVKLLDFRKKLPSWKQQEEIVNVIESNRVTVISGETGCGKTTQVPQFILDHYINQGRGSQCRVVCTQPRRISAITVAERVAQERGSQCGNHSSSAGYQIRLESKFPRNSGSILYCTTGIVLKWLESNPKLDHVSHLILDEIHERDLLADFLMIILKDVLEVNPDIRIILMSATLNAKQFSKYYNNAAMLHIPGFTYPVKEYYLEDVVDWLNYVPARQSKPPLWKMIKRSKKSREMVLEEEQDFQAFLRHMSSRYGPQTQDTLRKMDFEEIDLDLISELIQKICSEKSDGAILVFLPGWEQISTVCKQLQGLRMFQSSQYIILPLHSMMPTVNQREVFEKPPPGVRKIVLATNIAETSITIDDVVYVIDCGKIKLKNYDSQLNIATLQPEWNSLANSRQRRGRAGRVQPGECYHLYTTYHESKLEAQQKPEILRTRLEELCLQIKLLNFGAIKGFIMKAMDKPDPVTLDQSIELLMQLNALDENEQLTPLGHHLARLPVDPHAGKMILLGAMFSCLDPITTIAASLSFKDAFTIPLGQEAKADARKRELSEGSKSDHILLVKAYEGWERARRRGGQSQYCWDNYLSPSTLKMLENMKSQFTDLLYDSGFVTSRDPKNSQSNLNSNNVNLVKAIVCAGLYPNVAKVFSKHTKRGPVHKLSTKDGQKAQLHPKSVIVKENNLESQWLVYYLIMKTKSVNIFDATPVSPFSLLFFGGAIDFKYVERDPCITVDDWIQFRSERRVAELVQDLRQKLDAILSSKVRRPGVVEWRENSYEGRVMRAIQDLITKDDRHTRVPSRYDNVGDDDDDDDDNGDDLD